MASENHNSCVGGKFSWPLIFKNISSVSCIVCILKVICFLILQQFKRRMQAKFKMWSRNRVRIYSFCIVIIGIPCLGSYLDFQG